MENSNSRITTIIARGELPNSELRHTLEFLGRQGLKTETRSVYLSQEENEFLALIPASIEEVTNREQFLGREHFSEFAQNCMSYHPSKYTVGRAFKLVTMPYRGKRTDKRFVDPSAFGLMVCERTDIDPMGYRKSSKVVNVGSLLDVNPYDLLGWSDGPMSVEYLERLKIFLCAKINPEPQDSSLSAKI